MDTLSTSAQRLDQRDRFDYCHAALLAWNHVAVAVCRCVFIVVVVVVVISRLVVGRRCGCLVTLPRCGTTAMTSLSYVSRQPVQTMIVSNACRA